MSLVTQARRSVIKVSIVLGGLSLLLLNFALIANQTLMSSADNIAVNLSESSGGFNQSQLIPNADLLWLTGFASLLLIMIVDAAFAVIAIAAWQKSASEPAEP